MSDIFKEERLSPYKHLDDEMNKCLTKMYNCNELVDFVNWHLKSYGLGERYELENAELILSFLKGDKPEQWHRKLKDE